MPDPAPSPTGGRWPGPRACRKCGESNPAQLRPRSRICLTCRREADRAAAQARFIERGYGPLTPGPTRPWGLGPQPPASERFWYYVDAEPSGCWSWTGTLNHDGYGWITDGPARDHVHRWSYEHFIGPIPAGLQIDHLCRNRRCVNPTHLEPVTHAINIYRSKGKLTLVEAGEVKLLAGVVPMSALASRFGVAESTIRRIQTGGVKYV